MERRPLPEIAQLLADRGPSGAPLAALARALEASGLARNLFSAVDGETLVLAPPQGADSAAGVLRISFAGGEVVLSFRRPIEAAPWMRRVSPESAHGAVVEFLTARDPVPPGFTPPVS